jgi:nicotinate-nucleotide adenylyltransferase
VRIAILGGTFDPIHNGHLAAAEIVARAFDVDEVHFIPTFVPPHKPAAGITSPFHRFAMAALATEPFDRFRVSTMEVDMLEPRYSVDTLERMHQKYPGSHFVFITGTDMYRDIESWKEFRRLLSLTDFAVVHRPGFPMRDDVVPIQVIDEGPATTGEETGVYYFPRLEHRISSTEIRLEISRGGDTSAWLSSPVGTYIEKHKLYA